MPADVMTRNTLESTAHLVVTGLPITELSPLPQEPPVPVAPDANPSFAAYADPTRLVSRSGCPPIWVRPR